MLLELWVELPGLSFIYTLNIFVGAPVCFPNKVPFCLINLLSLMRFENRKQIHQKCGKK